MRKCRGLRELLWLTLCINMCLLQKHGKAAPIPTVDTERSPSAATPVSTSPTLIGHWKLHGDSRDSSGLGNHGINHGVDLNAGAFDGRGAYVEVPPSDSLKLGTRDFTFCARVWTASELDDIVGDVMAMYDPAHRKGVTLSIGSSSGGYQGPGDDRHIQFGIDNAKSTPWEDCGKPSPTSNYVSNSLTAYRGKLYAAVTDAKEKQDWCHVFRYDEGKRWTDCGRVGDHKTPGVGPLIVHNDELYAVTWTYDWTRVVKGDFEAGRVYRYKGGTEWEDLGQPSENRTLNTAVSFKGKLYVGGGPKQWGVFVRENEQGNTWIPSKLFPMTGPERCFPHAMGRFNGKLYVAYPSAYAFDGKDWAFAGLPVEYQDILQTHSLYVYQGKLIAGTWPEGKVVQYQGGRDWREMGRVGSDGTEVNALVVYNGKLYGGSIPRAEVCRYDGSPAWTSLNRFYSPEGWRPEPPAQVGGKPTRKQVAEWTRVTSLTVHNGHLFASIGSCTSSVLDAPSDVRGKVFRMEAGKSASYDNDLGPGWKHLAAVRAGNRLRIYVDGKEVAQSSEFNPADYDVTSGQPLRIGAGEIDTFCGKLADVRLYRGVLPDDEIQKLAASNHGESK